MYQNTPQNFVSFSFVEMHPKKKLLLVLFVFLFTVWMFGLPGRQGLDEYLAMKQSLERYDMLLRSTRQQLLDRLTNCKRGCADWDPELPVIYVITPTYSRPVQKAELTRLTHVLLLVNNVHWIIVEDSPQKTDLVENLLIQSTLNYTHLNEPTPSDFKRKGHEPYWKKPRGVAQRNAALRWLRTNKRIDVDKGVVYFADDDNTYTVKVFDEMRKTVGVSVWPVGLVGGLMVERPLVDPKNGKVMGFNSAWRPDRAFPVDMAGFAINLNLILQNPKAQFSFNSSLGLQESELLKQFTTRDRLEPLADNCTQVLVWHTRTEQPILKEEQKLYKMNSRSDAGMEV